MIGRLKALIAGFLLGIFIAPRSGRASRQLLLDVINDFFEMGTRRLEALEEELAERRSDSGAGRSPIETGVDPLADEPLA